MTTTTPKQAHDDFDKALTALCLAQDDFQESLKQNEALAKNDSVFDHFTKLGSKIADVKKTGAALTEYTYAASAQEDDSKPEKGQNDKQTGSKSGK